MRPPVLEPSAPEPATSVTSAGSPHRSSQGRLSASIYFVLFIVTVVLTPVLILSGAIVGSTQILAAIVALVALALIPWRPLIGLYILTICAVVIEQEPLTGTPIGTDHLYIFSWPPNLAGLPERPIGFFILAVLGIIVLTRILFRRRPLYGGKLFYPFIFFLGCVAMGIVHGLTSGGDFRIMVLEIRPWWYFFVSYILAFNTVSKISHVRNILWITIIGTAFKGVQGVYIVYADLGGRIDGHNEIMAHEQSYFFVLVLLLLILMLLHRVQRAYFVAILLSLPCILIALIANNRRADYVALVTGVIVAWALVIVIKPTSRKILVPALVLFVLLGGAYVLAFHSSGSALGAPANAIISVFHPSLADARDAASNLYRSIEDADLKYTEAQSPLLGYGFGKPFLQPEMLPDIAQADPYYLYIPHNNVLWIWMRLGPLGFAALWYLIGTALICGCLIAKRLKNPELRLFAIFAVAALVMEVLVAYSDYQFYFYRNIIYIGIVLGVLFKLPAIARDESPEESAEPDSEPKEDGESNKRKPNPRGSLLYASLPLTQPQSASSPPIGMSSRGKQDLA
jgi:hypothetical protein